MKSAQAGSFENLRFRTNKEYLFVDFRTLPDLKGGQWLKDRIASRVRRYYPLRASWPKVFNALVFTRTMYPSTKRGD